jgi:hypothetical protein
MWEKRWNAICDKSNYIINESHNYPEGGKGEKRADLSYLRKQCFDWMLKAYRQREQYTNAIL